MKHSSALWYIAFSKRRVDPDCGVLYKYLLNRTLF
jgi:hypothetical protein